MAAGDFGEEAEVGGWVGFGRGDAHEAGKGAARSGSGMQR